ncbi:MAG: RNA-binding protein [Gammaproteobacteria bacterium]|nr:RNA-binding protein [Gammaproteobacteria bacterium]
MLSGKTASRSKKSGATSSDLKTLFVGNLAFKARRDELSTLFSEYGQVNSVRIMTDRETRRPRGFGFIEMNANDAKAAIKALDGYEFMGRELKVNEANERKAD